VNKTAFVQPLPPFNTQRISLASGVSIPLNAYQYQVKYLRASLQAGSDDTLFVSYGSDPAKSVADATHSPPLPPGVGIMHRQDVLRLHDVDSPEGQGQNAGVVYIMRPADGVAGDNVYELMFTTRPDADIFPSPRAATDDGCCPSATLFEQMAATETDPAVATIDLSALPGIRNVLIYLETDVAAFDDTTEIVIDGYCITSTGATVRVWQSREFNVINGNVIAIGVDYLFAATNEAPTTSNSTDFNDVTHVIPYPLPMFVAIVINAIGSANTASAVVWGH
jgi:hypothetical protein